MKRIFFYGLFMDAGLLEAQGLHPRVVGRAELPGFQILIGDKATLISRAGSTAYGIVMELSDEEASALYSQPGVIDYLPEQVRVTLLDDGTGSDCLCYNLPEDAVGDTVNVEYAEKLATLVVEQGFPEAYAREILRRPSGV